MKLKVCVVCVAALVFVAGCDERNDGEEAPMAPAPAIADPLYALGQALFFDKILSGNRDVACATCHHPALGTDDDLPLSRGVGATGLGDTRAGGELVPRNAPALFNLHLYPTMFWDSRIHEDDGVLVTPAGDALTAEMRGSLSHGVVAAQALFPVVSREEMRGAAGSNELADFGDEDFQGVWRALMTRLGAVPEYVLLFESAYPGESFGEMSFAHAANAIAAYEIRAFEGTDSPYQRWLLGDEEALGAEAERGRRMFFRECGSCHDGALLSDFRHHNTGLAQFGPGAGHGAGSDDYGREGVTGSERDRYEFRTSPLTNIALSAPYGHAGEFADLGEFVEHYRNAAQALREYEIEEHVDDPTLYSTLVSNTQEILDSLDGDVRRIDGFDVDAVVAFLEATTAERVLDLSDTIPASVPSGLPVD